MTNTMFEFEIKDVKIMDTLEKIFADNWAFIIGHTRKDSLLRVLGPASDVQGITQKAKLTDEEQKQVLVRVVPEKEWVSKEK